MPPPTTRSDRVLAGSAVALDAGQVVVATQVGWPDRQPTRCPGASLLAGELRRRGVDVVWSPLTLLPTGRGNTTVHGLPGQAPGSWAMAGAAAFEDRSSDATLRAVLQAWSQARRPRSVLLASPRSFCAGVERAIDIVDRVLERTDAPVFVRPQIVHNTHVVRELEQRGAVFVEELDEVPAGATVVFSAHGVSPTVRAEAVRRQLTVIDATCPLVTKVHAEARRFAARGDTVVLIGHAGHEEVEGTLGEAPDHMVLVQNPAEVDRLGVADPRRVAYVTQTTLALDEAAETVTALRSKYLALRGPGSDDICYATTNRQQALAAVAVEADVVLVVGSANSSNSLRLVELARRGGTPAYLIDEAAGIRPAWIADAAVIGLTAGASAPPALVTEVVEALGGLEGLGGPRGRSCGSGPGRCRRVRARHRDRAPDRCRERPFALPRPVRKP